MVKTISISYEKNYSINRFRFQRRNTEEREVNIFFKKSTYVESILTYVESKLTFKSRSTHFELYFN